MAYKKITVPVLGTAEDRAALLGAFAAARPFAGHVEALFIHPDPREAVPYMGLPIAPEVVQQIIDNAGQVAKAGSLAARRHVEAAAAEAGVRLVGEPVAAGEVTCGFHAVYGGFTAALLEAAELSDLLVFGAGHQEGGPDIHESFIEVLLKSERPVLLAPQMPVTDLTPKVVIGWDGRAAAAHALTAAVPLLAKAGMVELYSIQNGPARPEMLEAPSAYLALHGIKAGTRVIEAKGESAGAVLLREAEIAGATLLVAGGYGHSRFTETLFGGATMHVTQHASLPLLLVH